MYTVEAAIGGSDRHVLSVLCRHRRRFFRRSRRSIAAPAWSASRWPWLGAVDRGEHFRRDQRRAFQPGRDDRLFVDGPDRAAAGRLYIVAQLSAPTVAAAACNVIFPAEAVTAAKLGIPLPGSDSGDCSHLAADRIHPHVPADDGDLRHGRRRARRADEAGRLRHRAHGGVRYSGRRAGDRRVDEPGPLVRPGAWSTATSSCTGAIGWRRSPGAVAAALLYHHVLLETTKKQRA